MGELITVLKYSIFVAKRGYKRLQEGWHGKINPHRSQLTSWAESLIHMNHHGTLVQREIAAGNPERASDLAERARKRAWKMLNELFECGAEKPEGYLRACWQCITG